MDSITALYTYCQGDFIPLHPDTKRPINTDWTTTQLNGQTAETASAFAAIGYNIGYRIPQNTLVIDVDPRSGGDVSFLSLPDDVQALPITTVTPSGGYHIYTTLPSEYQATPLRSKLKNKFPGIDFLKQGKQVLLPGSSLPGNFYARDASPLLLPRLPYTLHPSARLPPPLTPISLLTLLKRPITDSSTVPSGFLTNTDLTAALTPLPVLHYNDNDSWLNIMMACHHATAGDGLEAFLAWSLQDPEYAAQEQIIRSRWSSATVEDTGAPMITVRSLCHELQKHGALPTWLRVKAGLQQTTDSLFTPLTAATVSSDHADTAATYMEQIEQEDNAYRLLPSLAVSITSDAALLESHRDMLLRQLAKKTGVSITSIRTDIKALLNTPTLLPPHPATAASSPSVPSIGTPIGSIQPLDDSQIDLRIATALIDQVMVDCGNVRPVYTSGAWWTWNNSHWARTTADQDLKRGCISITQNMGVNVKANRITQIIDLAKMQIESSYNNFIKTTNDVQVFTKNLALTYNRKTHKWDTNEHSPDNRNLSTINTDYNPSAPLPRQWLKFLGQATTSDQARRTLACAIIYAAGASPPWLRKAFFLYGPSGTGKSATLDFIEGFLHPDNCTALNISQLGSRNGPAELVGRLANISNETMSRKAFQDDVFKALISGESILVEKKYCDPFAFRNRAKFFLAANGFPRVSDESDAVWNRITLLSYPNPVKETDMDPFLQEKFAQERAGVLNWALKIFAEEYARDKCRSAMQPDAAGIREIHKWRRVNNPALEWLRDRVDQTYNPDDRMTCNHAYADYKRWTHSVGHRASAKNQFSRIIGSHVQITKEADGKTTYVGIKLQPVKYFGGEA